MQSRKRFACYGRDDEDNVCNRNVDTGNLIDWIGRTVEGNSQFEYGGAVVHPAGESCSVEIAVAALDEPSRFEGLTGVNPDLARERMPN